MQAMRSAKVFLASGIVIFAIFFLDAFQFGQSSVEVAGRAALGGFAFLAAAVSLFLLSKSQIDDVSPLDWLACAFTILLAITGFAGVSITLFAVYLLMKYPHDQNTKAAATVAAAVAVQTTWAPLIFSNFSTPFLQIDAGIVGWLIGHIIPDASWSGTVVYTPSGHNVAITPPCASFHNLSLASLCWITLTMFRRPHWAKGDLYIGLGAALIQFGFNVWRLVFVCLSLPMYEFWHEGFGKHIFSAVATACAIIFVQIALVRSDQRGQHNGIGFASIS
jgi:hypothetical protein